jgi:hypothetical protein
MSVGTLRMARNGFKYFEGYQLETQFVLCKIKIGHAVSLAAVR